MSTPSVPHAPAPSATPNPTVVLDTSVWLSWLLPADANHTSALNWISRHVQNGGSFLSPVMLVIETASGIARATNQSAIAIRAAHQLYTLPFIHIVPIDQHLVNEAANIAATYRLRGADSIFVALAKIEAVPLVSFDQVQLTRPIGVIDTIRP